jgi:4-oxalocrotonate tautomerase
VRNGDRKSNGHGATTLLVQHPEYRCATDRTDSESQPGPGLHLPGLRPTPTGRCVYCITPSLKPANPEPRNTMPTYHIEMMEGRTLAQKKKLVEEITRVTVEVLGSQPESVDIIITDVKRENWATGGKLWSEPRT